ncbi:MAG TPA: hypothetical protein VNH18_25135 [Bryobacteraceae bacterium]|nr:hypothetical protein [Bryobacteraceae bacterium]
MRTTVNLPDGILRNAQKLASQRGITFSVVVEEALCGYLSKGASVRTPAFELHTVGGRLVQPHLDLDRTSALLTQADEFEFGDRTAE